MVSRALVLDLMILLCAVICFGEVCNARAEECRYDFDKADFVGDCEGSSRTPPPRAPSAPPRECDEAKIGADWVLAKDAGARRTYNRARQNGQSPFEALITAQGHNANAQRALRRCGEWIGNYAAVKERGVPLAANPPSGAAAARRESQANGANEQPTCVKVRSKIDNYERQRKSYRSEEVQWQVDAYVDSTCSRKVTVDFLLAWGDGGVSRRSACYGPGCNAPDPISFIRLKSFKTSYNLSCKRCIWGTMECDLGCD